MGDKTAETLKEKTKRGGRAFFISLGKHSKMQAAANRNTLDDVRLQSFFTAKKVRVAEESMQCAKHTLT